MCSVNYRSWYRAVLVMALFTVSLTMGNVQAKDSASGSVGHSLKIVRYGPAGEEKPGLLDSNNKIRDLSAHIADVTPAELSEEALATIGSLKWADLPEVKGDPRLGMPVDGVGKIIAVGFNYLDHIKETGQEVPKEPVIFMKATTSLSGPNDDVIRPRNSEMLDWEVELAIVIGKKAQYVEKENAAQYIAGYSIGNDVTDRGFQIYREGQFVKGKSADTFAPIGPYLLVDKSFDASNQDVWLEVNGEIQQQSNTEHLLFDPEFLVSYVSEFMTLEPGDIILTGTPGGIGGMQKPPRFLKDGDRMRLGISGLGEQSQTVTPYH